MNFDQVAKFADEVGAYVEAEYKLLDGNDLCYNLVGRGTIKLTDSIEQAARIVAQHLEQP